jgi:ketosteroid isomerase-like protein
MFLQGINKIKEMRKMEQKDMEFFDQSLEDNLEYMKEYSKMDKARKTDFKQTFPELEWLYQ